LDASLGANAAAAGFEMGGFVGAAAEAGFALAFNAGLASFLTLGVDFLAAAAGFVAFVDFEKKEKRLPCFNDLAFFAGGAMINSRSDGGYPAHFLVAQSKSSRSYQGCESTLFPAVRELEFAMNLLFF
jgi:hypothetical protein